MTILSTKCCVTQTCVLVSVIDVTSATIVASKLATLAIVSLDLAVLTTPAGQALTLVVVGKAASSILTQTVRFALFDDSNLAHVAGVVLSIAFAAWSTSQWVNLTHSAVLAVQITLATLY